MNICVLTFCIVVVALAGNDYCADAKIVPVTDPSEVDVKAYDVENVHPSFKPDTSDAAASSDKADKPLPKELETVIKRHRRDEVSDYEGYE